MNIQEIVGLHTRLQYESSLLVRVDVHSRYRHLGLTTETKMEAWREFLNAFFTLKLELVAFFGPSLRASLL